MSKYIRLIIATRYSVVPEILDAAGGVLRVEGDVQRAGTNSGGTWRTIERGKISGGRTTRGR